MHDANSALVSAYTDLTGTATFRIEGAAAGAASILGGSQGCAIISAGVGSYPWNQMLLTNGIEHPTVMIAAPDLAAFVGTQGVDITDLSFYLSDKAAFFANNANYRQWSDLDFHLPVYKCQHIFNPGSGFGVNLGDLAQWVMVKNAAGSYSNGPFPTSYP